jgi:hypothetical protein
MLVLAGCLVGGSPYDADATCVHVSHVRSSALLFGTLVYGFTWLCVLADLVAARVPPTCHFLPPHRCPLGHRCLRLCLCLPALPVQHPDLIEKQRRVYSNAIKMYADSTSAAAS